MKKITRIVAIVLAISSVLILGAFNSAQGHELNGTYSQQLYSTTTFYTFENTNDENKINISLSVLGHETVSVDGTYEISDDGTQITISIPNKLLSAVVKEHCGTFSFSEGEDEIVIGSVRYDKVKSQNNADHSISNIDLSLPEEYEISYAVKEESTGITKEYTQSISQSKEGIELQLGDAAIEERYRFEPENDGKYIMYQYEKLSGKYIQTSPLSMDQKLVYGYTARVTSLFSFYESFRDQLVYEGDEIINDTLCEKYTASFTTLSSSQTVEVWIDPTNGLCMRAEYTLDPAVAKSSKTIECTSFTTGNAAVFS